MVNVIILSVVRCLFFGYGKKSSLRRVKRFQKWNRMEKPMRLCDNLSQAVLKTLKFWNISRCYVIKKRVAGAGATCQRNMFSEIKSPRLHIVFDDMML